MSNVQSQEPVLLTLDIGLWTLDLFVPLYHPSPQALASHRREAAQLADYKAVARALRRAAKI